MNTAAATLTDNPCWGGIDPEQNNLDHLLNIIGENNTKITSQSAYYSLLRRIHEKLIVFQDENYLVINKPPDLRMDGAYGASMHKLLLYLFPPPSLSPSTSDSDFVASSDGNNVNNNAEESIGIHYHQMLLQKIAPLSKHSCLKDDPFRIVHQLDYATSGVLLYAKNKCAAGIACRSFQERRTNKEYVAVVINSSLYVSNSPLNSDFIKALPTLSSSCLSEWKDGSLENRYRRKRRRETTDRVGKKVTFDGFMPVHSVFAKWRGSLLRIKKEKEGGCNIKQNSESRSKKKSPPPLPEPEIPLTNEEIDEVLSYGPSWKEVKNSTQKHSRCWVSVVERMSNEYNESLAKFYAAKDETEMSPIASKNEKLKSPLPPLFRIQSKPEGNDSNEHVDSFYICASIGEPKDGRFEVLVDPSVSKASSVKKEPPPDMKPSLTKCTVLWRGCLKISDNCEMSIPVTKVLLQPLTGRRHQLRVHLAHVAGFPILGDVAYGGNVEVNNINSDNITKENSRTEAVCRRMCLHAKKLTIPLMEGKVHTFETQDHFRIVKRAECEGENLEVLYEIFGTR